MGTSLWLLCRPVTTVPVVSDHQFALAPVRSNLGETLARVYFFLSARLRAAFLFRASVALRMLSTQGFPRISEISSDE